MTDIIYKKVRKACSDQAENNTNKHVRSKVIKHCNTIFWVSDITPLADEILRVGNNVKENL